MELKIVRTSEELLAVQRLRHDVFRKELNKAYKEVLTPDGESLIADDIDERSVIFYVEDQGDIVGSIRNFNAMVKDFPADLVDELDLLPLLVEDPDLIVSTTGRFVVDPEYRKTGVGLMLLAALSQHIMQSGSLIDFVTCTPGTLNIYYGLSCRQYGHYYTKGKEKYLRLALFTRDLDYGRLSKNPFLSNIDESLNDHGASARKFDDKYADFTYLNHYPFLSRAKQVIQETAEGLGFPKEAIQRLKDKFLVFHIPNGERIENKPNETWGWLWVLEGSVIVGKPGQPNSYRLLTAGSFYQPMSRPDEEIYCHTYNTTLALASTPTIRKIEKLFPSISKS